MAGKKNSPEPSRRSSLFDLNQDGKMGPMEIGLFMMSMEELEKEE